LRAVLHHQGQRDRPGPGDRPPGGGGERRHSRGGERARRRRSLPRSFAGGRSRCMKRQVAVLDDLEAARQMMERGLSHASDVRTYASVASALQAFDGDRPDAIVTDLRMPGIDGLQGLRLFRDRGIDAPVIVVTAYASVETAVEAMKAGAFE